MVPHSCGAWGWRCRSQTLGAVWEFGNKRSNTEPFNPFASPCSIPFPLKNLFPALLIQGQHRNSLALCSSTLGLFLVSPMILGWVPCVVEPLAGTMSLPFPMGCAAKPQCVTSAGKRLPRAPSWQLYHQLRPEKWQAVGNTWLREVLEAEKGGVKGASALMASL